MERNLSAFLQDWLRSDGRKPLIIRGARQVGKTWLIRDLARREDRRLIEMNFDLLRLGPVCIKDRSEIATEYRLLSLPFYLLGQLHRLIQSAETA